MTKPNPNLAGEATDDVAPIAKPSAFDLDKFKSKRAAAMADVETLQTALAASSHRKAKDFVAASRTRKITGRTELCFVNVPIKGQRRDTLHLIEEELAMQYLPSGSILRFRLALATKPYDVFFLATCRRRTSTTRGTRPTCRPASRRRRCGCRPPAAKERRRRGLQDRLRPSTRRFPEPKWPTQSLAELIGVTFAGRMIDTRRSSGLLRLIGAKQNLS